MWSQTIPSFISLWGPQNAPSHTPDLEKAASGACGHFVRNHAIFRTFLVQYPVVFTEEGGGGDDYRELRLDKVDLR